MFAGFPPEALKFFRSLARNNRREWFQPRKEIFDSKIKAPMTELVEELNSSFVKFAPAHIQDPSKAIYRIYRDTRFSSDKTPYKDHLGAIFPRKGSGLGKHVSAGYYVAISAKGVEIAGGMYAPGPAELIAVRSWLADNHVAFRKATRGPVKLMGELQGESLTRPPKGFAANHPAVDILKMKQWLYFITLEPELAMSAKLLPEVIKRFQAMMPVIEMLNKPLAGKKKSAMSLLME